MRSKNRPVFQSDFDRFSQEVLLYNFTVSNYFATFDVIDWRDDVATVLFGIAQEDVSLPPTP